MKLRNLFLLLAAGAFALTSCSKDDSGNAGFEEDEISFFLQIDQNIEPRADADKAQGGVKVSFSDGALFFYDGSGNIVRYVIITDNFLAGSVSPAELQTGVLFKGISNTATGVSIVGNVDFTDPALVAGFATIADMETAVGQISILDQTDADYGVSAATLYGSSPLSSIITLPGAVTAGADREAKVTLRPLIARFEIEKISGWNNSGTPANGVIKDGFKVEGIYIDDFYYNSTIAGNLSAWQNIEYDTPNSYNYYSSTYSSTPITSPNGDTFMGYNTAGWQGKLFDEFTANNVASGNSVVPQKEAWVYNLYAEKDTPPHIILHLTGVQVWNDVANDYELFDNTVTGNAGECYLTITGFRSASGSAPILGGYIYRMADVNFKGKNDTDGGDLTEEPEGPGPGGEDNDKFDVWVEVELMEWTVMPVTPEFN